MFMLRKTIAGKTAFLACLMLGWAALGAAAGSDQSGVGTLTVKIGRVEIMRAGATQWNPAEKGMLLFEGDRIKTGELARAAVLLDDGSLLRLNANTDLALKEKKPGKKEGRLKVLLGRLWAKISQQDSQLEIETPTAVAAIKGTALELVVNSSGQSILIVWDGLVEFYNELGKRLVQASQQSTSEPGQAPGAPQKVDLKSLDRWFETVVELPAARTLKATVKDKQGKEYRLNLKYQKK